MCVPLVLYHSSERGCVWDEERGAGSASKPGGGGGGGWDATLRGEGTKGELGSGQLLWGGGGRIGGPFVSCQEKSVTNYLCLSPKGQLWKLFGWVHRKDA